MIKNLKHRPGCFSITSLSVGAIKFTKTELYSSVIEDNEILKERNKDTSRLLEAGAEKVVWIKSPRSELEAPLSFALSKLGGLDCILIEGNSAIEFARPDIVIFVFGKSADNIKTSAPAIIRQADIVIAPESYSLDRCALKSTAKRLYRKHYPYKFDDGLARDIIAFMETIEKNKEIEHLLSTASIDGRVTCTQASKIAEDLGVPYVRIGAAADELHIKIKNCELGSI